MLHLYFKYDTWIELMGRFLFSTLLGGLVLCDLAIGCLEIKFNISRMFQLWQIAFLIGVGVFFAIEVVFQCL